MSPVFVLYDAATGRVLGKIHDRMFQTLSWRCGFAEALKFKSRGEAKRYLHKTFLKKAEKMDELRRFQPVNIDTFIIDEVMGS
jgi:hypothetical protein